jgi:hypothetical protein
MRRPGKATTGASKPLATANADQSDVDATTGLSDDGWTRSEEVELQCILASGSGPEWQRYVREAQKIGRTLPMQRGAFALRRNESSDSEEPEPA